MDERREPRLLKTVYSIDMVASSDRTGSPSAGKPLVVAEALRTRGWPLEIVPPEPITVEALHRVHEKKFVDDVLALKGRNGFGSLSDSVARSLRFTCGAFQTAAILALQDGVSASLTSGFHHAHYASARGYCTFNGLMATAVHLLDRRLAGRLAILDCDFHYGDGTQAIIDLMGLEDRILHVSFGRHFRRVEEAPAYMAALRALRAQLSAFVPDVIFYQAGADVHVNDPLGGLLTTEQMRERDRTVFETARALGIPLTWNLAGGYQKEADGSIPRVVDLHLNTFEQALRVWGLVGDEP